MAVANGSTTTIRCRLTLDTQNALACAQGITSYLGFGRIAYAYDSRGTYDEDSIADIEVPTDRLDDARDYLDGHDSVRIYEVRS